MSAPSPESLKAYLSKIYGSRITNLKIKPIGGNNDPEKALKEYGYGTPLKLNFTVEGEAKSLIFNTVRPGGFGHDTMPDRAAILLFEAKAYNTLPRHVQAIDVGAFTNKGLISLRDIKETFLLTEYAVGTVYREDLDRIKEKGTASQLDHDRAKVMAKYLAEIHREKRSDLGIYERRNRELIGHNECIFGLTDSYPPNHEWIKPEMLMDIEKKCIEWRWRNKNLNHRLSRVHGDFHPFNILFREGTDFSVLDRSRGEYGEPADDLAALSINYLFWGLMHKHEFTEPFCGLMETFIQAYLEESRDEEILEVIPPYLCWRALIVGSPVWYRIDENVRHKLINFARNVLDHPKHNWRQITPLLEDRSW